jgi:hypothetical protein
MTALQDVVALFWTAEALRVDINMARHAHDVATAIDFLADLDVALNLVQFLQFEASNLILLVSAWKRDII